MKFLQIFLLLLLCTVVSSHEFTTCGNTDHLHLTSVDFSNDQVEPGSDLKVSIRGTPDVSISKDAEALIEMRIHGIRLYSEKVNLCDEFEVECPLESGKEFSAAMTYSVPSETPAIDLQLSVKVTDKGQDIGCFKTEVEVVRQGYHRGNIFRYLFSLLIKEHQLHIDDFDKRLAIFTENLLSIVEHNANKENTYTKAMNEFGHLTREEFMETRLGYNLAASRGTRYTILERIENGVNEITRKLPNRVYRVERSLKDLPQEVDWVSKGAVTNVKNQGTCGSCWSFSATGAIEGAYFLKTGKLVSFSEQQLVDCDKDCFGCKGGMMDSAFEWIEDHKGMCSEEDYPYVSENGIVPDQCSIGCKIVSGSAVKSFVDVVINSEESLMAAVAQQPISVAIEADSSTFQFYKSGVMTGRCGAKLDHGVLAVGYGTSSDGIDFWKVKNSWGPNWGEDGYVRLQRGKKTIFNKSGECGILKDASFPVLV